MPSVKEIIKGMVKDGLLVVNKEDVFTRFRKLNKPSQILDTK